MLPAIPSSPLQQYVVLLAAIVLVSLGLSYAKPLIAFLLTSLYEYLIQGHKL